MIETTSGQSTHYLPGLAQYGGNAWSYYLPDRLGSVRQLANNTGQVTLARSYDPFGNLLEQTGAGQSSFGYTGEQVDPTGLVFLRARYYNPSVGRFLTADSVVPDPLDSQAWNRYAYVYNNSVRFADPSGYCPPSICRDEQGRPSDPYYRWGDRDYLKTLSLIGPNPWFTPQPGQPNPVCQPRNFKEMWRGYVRTLLPESWRDAYDMQAYYCDIFEQMAAIGMMTNVGGINAVQLPFPSAGSNLIDDVIFANSRAAQLQSQLIGNPSCYLFGAGILSNLATEGSRRIEGCLRRKITLRYALRALRMIFRLKVAT